MKTYIGTKIVEAIECKKDGQDGYKVKYKDGYESWSPAGIFESAYHGFKNLTFSEALFLLKDGELLAREGWAGKDLYVELFEDGILGDNGFTHIKPFFTLFNSREQIRNTWVPSVSDLLAEDWVVVKK